MSEDLRNEVEAINSIYGDESLTLTPDDNVYILNLPEQAASLRIQFPPEYPSIPPIVVGTQSSGEHTRKGEAAHTLEIFKDAIERLFVPGEVCLFDVIEEVNGILESAAEVANEESHDVALAGEYTDAAAFYAKPDLENLDSTLDEPPWTLSEVVIELKSVFIARAAPVASPDQAAMYLQHLLDSDKKVRSATHNMTAWRIKGENGVTYQDCDDDGETAAGGRLLHLMQLMDIWDVMVVVTRWYGGHHLGPRRFSIINMVARDAFVKAGLLKDEKEAKKKNKR